MQHWKRWLIFGAATLVFLAMTYVLFTFLFLDFFVDLWWFESLGYKAYFLLRLFYRYLIFIFVLTAFFALFFLNFWVASRYLGHSSSCSVDSAPNHPKLHKVMLLFQTGSLKIYTPISILMAVPMASPFFDKWEQGLLFFFAPESGISDKTFGADISFYLFRLPIYQLLQNRFLIVFSLLFLALALLYFVEHHLLCRDDEELPRGAKIHLTVIAVVIVLAQAWGFMLERLSLVYTDSHMPHFFGPGFVEMWIDLPLIWLTAFSFLGAAFSTIVYIHRRKGAVVLLVFAACFFGTSTMKTTRFLQAPTQAYFVGPNEPVRERPFIERSVRSTLAAYRLDNVETRDYRVGDDKTVLFSQGDGLQESLRNIPVWDRELLDEVYEQVQSFRTYYTFPEVDVDRYTVNGLYQQVHLAARELDTSRLPETARNWINTHLQYTHGYGVVMSPAAQSGDEPMIWFVKDIPIQSDFDFHINRPEIYYGMERFPEFTLAPNDIGEIDLAAGNGNEGLINYEGSGGIPLTSFRKLLFSVYFGDKNIFFTDKTNADTRLLLRRNIRGTIRRLTPFFTLDNDPYIVATREGLFWIIDGYTLSEMYPNAQKFGPRFVPKGLLPDDIAQLDFNYIRNSVKIVVDAYNGNVDYYVADTEDPIIRGYQRVYPGLLKDMDEMPAEIKKHIRYPKVLFTVQMGIYSKYHQTDPNTFYLEEDNWEFTRMDVDRYVAPYYLTLNLFDSETFEFMQVTPMSPLGRNNLRALAIAGCDGDNYGKILVYRFPKGQQVYGPSQITALINQDTAIAQVLTLWSQAGSQVRFGRMIILPVADSVLYIQPIYLQASSRLNIPELKRIVVSQGTYVVEARSLQEGLDKIEQRIRGREPATN